VLARLQEENDIQSAKVDRRGELLRLRLTSSDVTGLVRRLAELGFSGEEVPGTDVPAVRWYGLEDVGELSREEAAVIAERVVPSFATAHGITAAETSPLREIVASALHACFVTHPEPAALDVACGHAVEQATRNRLGPDRAAALGRAIHGDLASRSGRSS
jgi:hypothetical protein